MLGFGGRGGRGEVISATRSEMNPWTCAPSDDSDQLAHLQDDQIYSLRTF